MILPHRKAVAMTMALLAAAVLCACKAADTSTSNLAVGDCLNSPYVDPKATPEKVDCAKRHESQVIGTIVFSDKLSEADIQAQCHKLFQSTTTGVPPNTGIEVSSIQPGGGTGDIYCVANGALTGSIIR